jgi:hypothetical protein
MLKYKALDHLEASQLTLANVESHRASMLQVLLYPSFLHPSIHQSIDIAY